jgi:hypothetical protein
MMSLRRALTLQLMGYVAAQLSLLARHVSFSKGVFVPEQGRHLLNVSGDAESGFLSELPLTVVSITPASLRSPLNDSIPIFNGESIRIVFSRAVIPLGADVSDVAPFVLFSPGAGNDSVGRFCWVNSYTARFDPIGNEWGADLSLKLTWNRDLVSWDGVSITGLDKLQVC